MVKCVLKYTHLGVVDSTEFNGVTSLGLKPTDLITVNTVKIEIREVIVDVTDDLFTKTYIGTSSGVPQ